MIFTSPSTWTLSIRLVELEELEFSAWEERLLSAILWNLLDEEANFRVGLGMIISRISPSVIVYTPECHRR